MFLRFVVPLFWASKPLTPHKSYWYTIAKNDIERICFREVSGGVSSKQSELVVRTLEKLHHSFYARQSKDRSDACLGQYGRASHMPQRNQLAIER